MLQVLSTLKLIQPQMLMSSTELPSMPSLPSISFVNAIAYHQACQLPGLISFQLVQPSAMLCTSMVSDMPNLSTVPTQYHSFANVFSKSKANSLLPHRPYDLKIPLEEGSQPPLGPIYSLSPLELEALHTYLDKNLVTGTIQPSKLPFSAPILFIKKKDGSLRLCIDYQGLNKITKKDRYPLPLIANLLDAPHKARVYTKIDLRHAYNLIRIAPGDKWKTASCTCYGSFKWLVMPFSLSNAPSTFQRFMNDIFSDLLDECVVVYLDDILIYSEDESLHTQHIKEVLRHLCKFGLYAKAEKCEFHTDTTEYLGYVLLPSGLTMAPEKIQVIQDWPKP